MKKILFLIMAFIMVFNMSVFAADIIVTQKSEAGATVSIKGVSETSATGIWADYDSTDRMLTHTPVPITFTNGAATASYTGSFTNLKFILVKDMENIMPLCKAAEIVLDGIIFEPDAGIEDLGDVY